MTVLSVQNQRRHSHPGLIQRPLTTVTLQHLVKHSVRSTLLYQLSHSGKHDFCMGMPTLTCPERSELKVPALPVSLPLDGHCQNYDRLVLLIFNISPMMQLSQEELDVFSPQNSAPTLAIPRQRLCRRISGVWNKAQCQ